MIDLDLITRRFIMSEGKEAPSVRGYVESVLSIIETIRPKSQRESRQISVIKEHLREIRRINRKLEERMYTLEEQIKILEEGK